MFALYQRYRENGYVATEQENKDRPQDRATDGLLVEVRARDGMDPDERKRA